MDELDVLIQGGTVIDGSGAPAAVADVGIAADRICLGEALAGRTARRTLQAAGRFVTPGFIDIHSHSDFSCLIVPDAASRLTAGVTTEVMGNCGGSAFPLSDETRTFWREQYANRDIEIDWSDMAGYLEAAGRVGCGVNRAMLVGHGNLRALVAGNQNRPLTAAESDRIAGVLDDCLAAGAVGLSSGLIYPPGIFSTPDEMIPLTRVVARRDGFYASHIRSEGDTVLEATDEFLAAVRGGGCRGQHSHIKVVRPENWGKLDALRQRIEAARRDGLAVTADRYPYVASSTGLANYILPDWIWEGDRGTVAERLADRARREEILAAIRPRLRPDETRVVSVFDQADADACGKTLTAFAAARGGDPAVESLELLVRQRCRVQAVRFHMNPDNLRRVLQWPFVMIGSDSSIHALDSKSTSRPHPRAFGTPIRFLAAFVRDEGLIDWPAAIHKLTGMPAEVCRLTDRGRIAHGAAADLVVFDPEALVDRADYDQPRRAPEGIEFVFVNGVAAVEDGRFHDRRAGKLLLKGS
jgi:N-acyl-D-amino-acid deacylase